MMPAYVYYYLKFLCFVGLTRYFCNYWPKFYIVPQPNSHSWSNYSLQTDKASMLDDIIDYVKFLQLQVKVSTFL